MTTLTHITASGDLISAAAWELLLERWDAVRADLPVMDVSQVRARWLLAIHYKGMGSFRLASGGGTFPRLMRR